ncbi:MAG: methylamine utilization protein [Burkholderiales bacterium]|nr:methylamine utilization protein [Burkholderiales bacterium]
MLALAMVPQADAASIEAQVRDAAGKPLADAVVYAIPGVSRDTRPSRIPVAVEQVDREFVPYVTVVQTGATVTFPNRDTILHHVYSFSAAKPFEIKLYTGKSPTEVVFDKPGAVTLGCNIHDWMIGYILVVSTPHFAKADAAGNARLRDLPAGAYDIQAWHPQQRAAPAPQRVTLEAPSSPSVAFTVDAPPRKPKYKPPLDRLKY